jgi:hypothetical protein
MPEGPAMNPRRRARRGSLVSVSLAAAALLGVWYACQRIAIRPGRDRKAEESSPVDQRVAGPAAGIGDASSSNGQPQGPIAVSRRWGTGDDALGRTRPEQGNPEAPMSFAITQDGNLVVVDQVNGRLVFIDRNGRTTATRELTERVPQDVALGPHGETAILDRLGDRAVTIRGPSGKILGRLPLRGNGVSEPGLGTGVFIDGKDVYVERRHGPLVLVGDLNGNVAPDRTEIPGRPTRDGTLFVSAGIVDQAEGRMFVSAIDRRLGEHRFTREIRTGSPLQSIALLDSDRHGTIYVGVVLQASAGSWQRVYCMGPLQGEPLGQIEVPANTMPEETLRDMAVMDDGGVVVAERTEEGIRYVEHHCE